MLAGVRLRHHLPEAVHAAEGRRRPARWPCGAKNESAVMPLRSQVPLDVTYRCNQGVAAWTHQMVFPTSSATSSPPGTFRAACAGTRRASHPRTVDRGASAGINQPFVCARDDRPGRGRPHLRSSSGRPTWTRTAPGTR